MSSTNPHATLTRAIFPRPRVNAIVVTNAVVVVFYGTTTKTNTFVRHKILAALWESVRDVNETDERGRTLLYVACRKGDAHFARRALELSSGDTVNFTNVAGKHALYAAAAGGNEHVVELVVKAGAALEKKDRHGRSPLWAACYHLRPGAVARLLCLGADPNARDLDGVTPLIAAAAAEGGSGERGDDFGERRDSRRARAREAATAVLTFSDPDVLDLEARDTTTGCTALWAACASGCVGVALELIAAGADVDAKNAHGRTPLLAAALGGHCEIALALVAAGADIDAADDDGKTPLYAAAFENHPVTVAALVAAGADVDGGEPETREESAVDAKEHAFGFAETAFASGTSAREDARKGREDERKGSVAGAIVSPRGAQTRRVACPPPLVGACWRGNAAAVAALLADGPGFRPDLERVTSDGRTALAASCWRGEHVCSRLLLAAGAEVDHADADGRTALWAAARAGDATSVRLCVESGGDVDKKDARREAFSAGAGVATCTPLFAAVWQEEHDAVRALLDAGADPREGDGEGRAPLSLVDRGSANHTENTRRIREMLLEAVAKVEKSERAERSGAGGGASTIARARALRQERADAQARAAAAWAEKRAARRARDARDDDDGDAGSGVDSDGDVDDVDDVVPRPERVRDSSRTVAETNEDAGEDEARRARVSCAARRGARRVRSALAAFRDASRAARDAERATAVSLGLTEGCGAEYSTERSDTSERRQNPSRNAPARSRRRAAETRVAASALSPEEVSRLVARADETRVATRRALHARAREIQDALADLPDALERLRALRREARAAPSAPPAQRRLSSGKPGVEDPRLATSSLRGSHGAARVSFLGADETEEDDGWGGRARVDSRATMAVLGSE